MDRKALRGAYARLRAIKGIVQASNDYMMKVSVGQDFQQIVTELSGVVEEDLRQFHFPQHAFQRKDWGEYLDREEIRNKVEQLTAYLEYVFHVNEEIIEIGSIYNSIRDDELKSRCADLLSAPANFDRVINLISR